MYTHLALPFCYNTGQAGNEQRWQGTGEEATRPENHQIGFSNSRMASGVADTSGDRCRLTGNVVHFIDGDFTHYFAAVQGLGDQVGGKLRHGQYACFYL